MFGYVPKWNAGRLLWCSLREYEYIDDLKGKANRESLKEKYLHLAILKTLKNYAAKQAMSYTDCVPLKVP